MQRKRTRITSNERISAFVAFRVKEIRTTNREGGPITQSEELYRKLIETRDIGFVVLNNKGIVVDANTKYARLAGRREIDHVLGKNVLDWTAEHDRDRLSRELAECLKKGFARNVEIDHADGQGGTTPVEMNVTCIGAGSGKDLVAFCRDVPKRGHRTGKPWCGTDGPAGLTELADFQPKSTFLAVLENIPLGIILADRSGTGRYVNPQFTGITGYTLDDVPTEKDWAVRAYPDNELRKKVVEAWKRNRSPGSTYETGQRPIACKNGREKVISLRATRLEELTIITLSDATEKKQLEARLRQSEKMEAIGKLAGGIAHDFNNILEVLLGHCGILKMQTPQDGPLQERVSQIADTIEKASSFTRSLLAFSKKQDVVLRPTAINAMVRKSVRILEGLLPKNICLDMALGGREATVLMDVSKIDQVLLNLVANARDAMPQGGRITIRSRTVNLDEDFRRLHGYGTPGRYVLVTVTDTGEGIDDEAIHRIFEPFYTKKKAGKGTGLGLAIVYGIVKQHHGYINASSRPGRGTTFSIYLPVAETPERQ